MFSYAGFICAVPIRRKRSIDRSVMRLDFMAAVWREDGDSHATLLALLYFLYGQIQIVVVSLSKVWHVLWSVLHLLLLLLLPLALQPTVGLSNNVLPFFSICHQLSPSSHSQHLKISFTSSFHLFLRLPLLLVPSSSWVKRVFYVSHKMILRLHRRMDRVLNLLNVSRFQWRWWWGACYASLSYPVAVYRQNEKESENPSPRSFLTFQFSHSSDISQQCVKARVSPIWPLLASTHYLAS